MARGRHLVRHDRRRTHRYVSLLSIFALGMLAAVPVGANHGSVIASPEADEIIYQDSLTLAASYHGDADYNRTGFGLKTTCAPGQGVVVNGTVSTDGSVNILNGAGLVVGTPTWDGETFEVAIDVSDLDPGAYCFAFNPGVNGADRVFQEFYIVDEYVSVGGPLILGDGNAPRWTHVVAGVVANAGDAGTVGSINVNYRTLKQQESYVAEALQFGPASGIDSDVRAEITTTGGARIFLVASGDSPHFDRGAIVLRVEGTPSNNALDIDNTPGQTGADSWVGMQRGNIHLSDGS